MAALSRDGRLAAAAGKNVLIVWELATCKVLARRQQATVTAANRPEGGLVIMVRLPLASTDPGR